MSIHSNDTKIANIFPFSPQEQITQLARRDFRELLLEHIELFVDIIVDWRAQHPELPPLIGLDGDENAAVHAILREDKRCVAAFLHLFIFQVISFFYFFCPFRLTVSLFICGSESEKIAREF